ncbi:hypothetical protein V8G54_006660 [Vigna mungo]|uniref:Uncharacterized protein n=1 Tax=Vigna mungo TaxID=3915 RepID=A0AAQ3S7K4_VIGMU
MEAVVCPCRSLTGSMLHFSTLKVLHVRSTGPTVGLRHHGQEQDHDTWGSRQQHFLTPTLPGISKFYYSGKLGQDSKKGKDRTTTFLYHHTCSRTSSLGELSNLTNVGTAP